MLRTANRMRFHDTLFLRRQLLRPTHLNTERRLLDSDTSVWIMSGVTFMDSLLTFSWLATAVWAKIHRSFLVILTNRQHCIVLMHIAKKLLKCILWRRCYFPLAFVEVVCCHDSMAMTCLRRDIRHIKVQVACASDATNGKRYKPTLQIQMRRNLHAVSFSDTDFEVDDHTPAARVCFAIYRSVP